MKTTLNIGGKLAEPFTVGNGVKQGDTLAPTLFALYFTMVFQLAFMDSSEGVYIYYRTTGKLFNIKSFTARTKTMMCAIRELLYADDYALLTHSEMEMQHLLKLRALRWVDYQFEENCFDVPTNSWKNICRAINLCLRTKAGSRSKVCISWKYSQFQ